jgi:nitrite reductase/ring-hydroxylating ferredoxin subunit/uncharacterized membrane protein
MEENAMQRDFDERIETTLASSPTLKQTSKSLRGWLTKNFLESPLKPLKDFLNGTWLEHPLHPVLTDIPIGAWTAAMALDAATMVLGTRNLGKATGIAIGVGTAGALGAVATGLMDYTDTSDPEDTTALTHGLLNMTATVLFASSLLLRKSNGWRTEPAHVALSLLGYAAVTAGGFLGGSMVYRRGIMVNRNAYRSSPKKYTDAMPLSKLPEAKLTRVEVEGEPVLLLRRGDDVYALGAVCSHLGAPMEKGELKQDTIVCPWHYSVYSIEDGSVRQGPTTSPLPCYETRVREGQVQVRIAREG